MIGIELEIPAGMAAGKNIKLEYADIRPAGDTSGCR
jgi:hypothetical protein